MLGSIRAEQAKAVRRPAIWMLPTVAVVLSLTFAYLIPYAGFAGGTEGPPNSERGLASMLPAQFVGNSIGGTPVFVGALALALVLGVLAVALRGVALPTASDSEPPCSLSRTGIHCSSRAWPPTSTSSAAA